MNQNRAPESGPIPLFDGLPAAVKTLNWAICFLAASYVGFLGYARIQQILAPPLPISPHFYWFAILLTMLSPASIAAAWLRLTGLKWWQALLLLLFVPIGTLTFWFLRFFPYVFAN
jgi:hypothetical protein